MVRRLPGACSRPRSRDALFGMVALVLLALPSRPVSAQPQIGGKDFGIAAGPLGEVTATWSGGTSQLGYLLLSLDLVRREGAVIATLPASATSFTEPTAPDFAASRFACFLLTPYTATAAWTSDVLCVLRDSGTAAGAAHNFTVRLNRSTTASLSWNGPPYSFPSGTIGFGYTLNIRGAQTLHGDLAPSTTEAQVPVSVPTCFQLSGGAGISRLLCAIPGAGTIP